MMSYFNYNVANTLVSKKFKLAFYFFLYKMPQKLRQDQSSYEMLTGHK